MAAELGDDGAGLVAHGDIVDAAALGALALLGRRRSSRMPSLARRDEVDGAVLGDAALAVGVAGVGEGACRPA